MRMWAIRPACLCRKHLLGEHTEMHMAAAVLNLAPQEERWQKNLAGHVKYGQLLPDRVAERHDLLATEMTARGYEHKSSIGTVAEYAGQVPDTFSQDWLIHALTERCDDCRQLADAATESVRWPAEGWR